MARKFCSRTYFRHFRMLFIRNLGKSTRNYAYFKQPTSEERNYFNPSMLYIAIGILGATVMPHNLYLHSSLVQTRAYPRTLKEKNGDKIRNH